MVGRAAFVAQSHPVVVEGLRIIAWLRLADRPMVFDTANWNLPEATGRIVFEGIHVDIGRWSGEWLIAIRYRCRHGLGKEFDFVPELCYCHLWNSCSLVYRMRKT